MRTFGWNSDQRRDGIGLLFAALAGTGISKPFREGIVIDLEFGDLLVLVGGDSDELALLENVGAEGGVGQLEDVACAHQVEPRLVLVHRVQDRLNKN